MIHCLNRSVTQHLQNPQQNLAHPQSHKLWVTFTSSNPLIRKVTNIFRNTNPHTSFRTTNKFLNLLHPQTEYLNKYTRSGIHKITCNTCNKVYVGQSDRQIKTRFNKHLRYIKYNNPNSAYTQHILNNRHNFGTMQDTLQLLKTCTKGKHDLLGKLLRTYLPTTWPTNG
jgi:hypothetical protein